MSIEICMLLVFGSSYMVDFNLISNELKNYAGKPNSKLQKTHWKLKINDFIICRDIN